MILESQFQNSVIAELSLILPKSESLILKTDPNYIQGFPDLLILYKNSWFSLEVKRSINSPCSPNQVNYINYLNNLSFARFIYPENRSQVLDEIQQSFRLNW